MPCFKVILDASHRLVRKVAKSSSTDFPIMGAFVPISSIKSYTNRSRYQNLLTSSLYASMVFCKSSLVRNFSLKESSSFLYSRFLYSSKVPLKVFISLLLSYFSSTDKFLSAYLLANMAGANDSTGIIPVSVSS